MEDKFEKGIGLLREIWGPEQAETMRAMAAAGDGRADFARLAIEYAFGDVWTRPGLERKYRSIAVIAALVKGGQSAELGAHLRIGLRNGLTPGEIEEVLIQLVPYAGFPAVSQAFETWIGVRREHDPEHTTRTAAETGLL
jgi:4-carboxymuconolactone decarboxylase